MACTACFPLHKKKNFKRTRLSSTLCVPLHPSAGWLQGSPYRRFLLPPAFRFAGAAVLPGSGLGNRNLPRSSLPVPDGACRNSTCSPGCWCRCAIPGNPSCCCTDGNFSKKREGWTVPALLTKKLLVGSLGFLERNDINSESHEKPRIKRCKSSVPASLVFLA